MNEPPFADDMSLKELAKFFSRTGDEISPNVRWRLSLFLSSGWGAICGCKTVGDLRRLSDADLRDGTGFGFKSVEVLRRYIDYSPRNKKRVFNPNLDTPWV
jgi:hypothetical protein